MDVNYFLCNPTGNITALVESEVKVELHSKIGEMILAKEPTCEQVGFILPPENGSDITLRMAGGEFCGNATMSVAAFFCKKNGLSDGEEKEVFVRVIGTKENVRVFVKKEKGEYYGKVDMPKPRKIYDYKFTFESHNYIYPVVEFESISHVIIEDDVPVYMPEQCIKYWCDSLKAKALGLMLLNKDKTALRPLVYVKEPESLTWESSCGSGTTAVAAFLSKKSNNPVSLSLSEPGGILSVECLEDGTIKLSGKVEF